MVLSAGSIISYSNPTQGSVHTRERARIPPPVQVRPREAGKMGMGDRIRLRYTAFHANHSLSAHPGGLRR